MKFIKYLKKELIFMDMPCSTKKEAIRFLASELCKYYKIDRKEEIIDQIFKREEIKSTGMGKNLAVPHGREEFLDKLYIVFARSENGIDWGAHDGKKVNCIFLIIGPNKLAKEYLETLGDISRIMMRSDVREGLIHTKTPDDIIDLIKKAKKRKKKRAVK